MVVPRVDACLYQKSKGVYTSTLFLAALCLWWPAGASAQEDGTPYRERFGEYTLVYSVVRSDALVEAVARRHGLPTTPGALLLNVTVQHQGDNVPASIEARAVNLARQVRYIEMHETEANDLVSYIGIVEVADQEVLDFHLEVLPRGAEEPFRFAFRESALPVPLGTG